ncbi:beta-lactamase family protein [Flavisolibacter sp. BT320]|nr:beta-lactamase family protein [Flavisolibacter longurius]
MRKHGVTGTQVSFVKGGQEKQYFYGYSNADTKEKVTASTVFEAASLSKVVLAYITLRLVDRKQFSLDTPLVHYYAYERIKNDSAAQKVTARMVLHHTSGFPNWAANPLSKGWRTAPLHTGFEPGTGWAYSGEGFMFLQLAIESVLKQSLETIAAKEVFLPLQMKSSSFTWQPRFEKSGAFGHNRDGEVVERTEFFLPAGAYSLMTTAHDYQLFVQAMATGKGLSSATHQRLLRDAVPVKATGDSSALYISWGLGVGKLKNELGTGFWHWGDNGNFKCFFLFYPATRSGIVCMTNSENGLELMKPLFTYYFGKASWWNAAWLETAFKK